jgi:hypothetical protein
VLLPIQVDATSVGGKQLIHFAAEHGCSTNLSIIITTMKELNMDERINSKSEVSIISMSYLRAVCVISI